MAKVGVSMGDLVTMKMEKGKQEEKPVKVKIVKAEKKEEAPVKYVLKKEGAADQEEKKADQKKETESVTIRISKEEKKAFKALCAVRGVNMSDLLSDIVRDYLKENK